MPNRQVNVCLFVDYAFMMRKNVKSRFSVIRTHFACRKVNYHIVYTTAAEPQPFGCRPYMLSIFRKDIQSRRFWRTCIMSKISSNSPYVKIVRTGSKISSCTTLSEYLLIGFSIIFYFKFDYLVFL